MHFLTLGFFTRTHRATEVPISQHYVDNRRWRRREYGDRMRKVEYAVFSPLVFSSTGGMEKETTVAYKRLAELIAQKRKSEYGLTLAWMRCTLSFALIPSAVMAIRGSRSASNRNPDANIELGYSEGRLGVF